MNNELAKLQEAYDNYVVCQCEVYSRVVGYYRPVQFWSKGKKEEHRQRVNYIIKED